MAVKSLAVKYRPKTWDDVTEQDNIKIILQQQLATGTVKNAYLFCGGAGTGKTTCARIFATELNNHQGNTIELDAALNNSVDDIREIIQQAKTQSLDSEYKIFLLDEVQALSSNAWQAMLKLIEEPPAKSVFIMCTTDPQKIPKTILSRVQRYDFKRISQEGIENRLHKILHAEMEVGDTVSPEAVSFIAKTADGGMRDAITLLDKCLSYSTELTVENVVKALGVTDYITMLRLTQYLMNWNRAGVLQTIENVHYSGADLKQFIKQYVSFILDICKYRYFKDFSYLAVPKTKEMADMLNSWVDEDFLGALNLLDTLIKLNAEIKWDTNPKTTIEATLLLACSEGE